ncbi:MAG TPA: hypothetical protein VGJ77_12560 [Gaiellaceae bacterium]|jgi:hypothetical protein
MPDDDLEALGRAYASILHEARGAVAAGRAPDAQALEQRVREASRRVRSGSATDAARVDRAERTALQQLARVIAVHRARMLVAEKQQPAPATPPSALRRPLLRSRPTISGNMDVRRQGEATLSWDPATGVASWEVRISERPDPRREYVVRDTLTLAASQTTADLPLGEFPLRVHLLGRGRDGRLVRRAIISALTRDGWNERWQRRASAS